jgi:hypothetical protein
MDKAIILATGPSLTKEKTDWAENKKFREGWRLFGINNVYQTVPSLDCFLACNPEWWQEYSRDPRLRDSLYPKWTWDFPTFQLYSGTIKNFHYIEGKWGDSLSKDPNFIHYGHASGYQILNIAYHAGIREFYLLGYDMAYPPGERRHYFGEYPRTLYHNPRTGPNGEFTGLIKQFETINEADLNIKVYNLCETSALNHFEKATINDF